MNKDLFTPEHAHTDGFSALPPASVQPTLDFCRRLDSIVGPQLTVLASDICEQFNVNKRVSGLVRDLVFSSRL